MLCQLENNYTKDWVNKSSIDFLLIDIRRLLCCISSFVISFDKITIFLQKVKKKSVIGITKREDYPSGVQAFPFGKYNNPKINNIIEAQLIIKLNLFKYLYLTNKKLVK